ncbi:hypothetical protein [Gemmatimonas sp.]|uniref:hypothetical protein n=1 Tax=Gemmatimonas sp. TaxID=1962908 RepID=UPI00286D47F4|nr:hypothetical protein [Gemmatimonas sp.]
MNDAMIVYAINLIIGAILAVVMGRYWRLGARGGALRYWIVAAWTLTSADLLFVLRAAYPDVVVRMLPTLMVTVGQLVLIFAAQRTAERPTTTRIGVLIFALHTIFLFGFMVAPQFSDWRSVGNTILWGALAFQAAWVLSRPIGAQRSVMQIPAVVLAAHGVFQAMRLVLALRAAARPGEGLGPLVQLIGDLEVSLFMVALFVSVLAAFLEQSNRELRAAMDDVVQLSSMLPLCAWCKNVRNDDGYWQRIETYLTTHRVNVTHGICEDCAATHGAATPPAAPATS